MLIPKKRERERERTWIYFDLGCRNPHGRHQTLKPSSIALILSPGLRNILDPKPWTVNSKTWTFFSKALYKSLNPLNPKNPLIFAFKAEEQAQEQDVMQLLNLRGCSARGHAIHRDFTA